MAEKMLECIFTTSKHFSEGALIEYNAPAGSRMFELPGPPIVRDFTGLEGHYHDLWENAVNSRLPGFQQRAATARPASVTRNTLEAGLAMLDREDHGDDLRSEGLAGTEDTYVPRPVSPSSSLREIAHLLDDISKKPHIRWVVPRAYFASSVRAQGQDCDDLLFCASPNN